MHHVVVGGDALITAGQIRAATATKLAVPVLALNRQFGHPGMLEQIRLVADDITGETIPLCGHLLGEERPEAVAPAPRLPRQGARLRLTSAARPDVAVFR
jgi:hypothetical protein